MFDSWKKRQRWIKRFFSFAFFLIFALVANFGFATKGFPFPPGENSGPPRFIESRASLTGDIPEVLEELATPPPQVVATIRKTVANATSTPPEASKEINNKEITSLPRVPIAGNFIFKKVKDTFSAKEDLAFELDMKKIFSLPDKEIGMIDEGVIPMQQKEGNIKESDQKVSENESEFFAEGRQKSSIPAMKSASSTPDFSGNENNSEHEIISLPKNATSSLDVTLQDNASSTISFVVTPVLLALDDKASSSTPALVENIQPTIEPIIKVNLIC